MNAISNGMSRCSRALRTKKSAHLVRWLVLAMLTLYITAAGFAEGYTRPQPLDDSLAHECAHRIRGDGLNAGLADETLGNGAVAIQGGVSTARAKTAGMERGR